VDRRCTPPNAVPVTRRISPASRAGSRAIVSCGTGAKTIWVIVPSHQSHHAARHPRHSERRAVLRRGRYILQQNAFPSGASELDAEQAAGNCARGKRGAAAGARICDGSTVGLPHTGCRGRGGPSPMPRTQQGRGLPTSLRRIWPLPVPDSRALAHTNCWMSSAITRILTRAKNRREGPPDQKARKPHQRHRFGDDYPSCAP